MPIKLEDLAHALDCLYDTVALARSALGDDLCSVAPLRDPEMRAQALRAALLEAIEILEPSTSAALRSPAARAYHVLTLHYIEGLSITDVAEELHISRRQAYRDLTAAVRGLGEFIESRNAAEATSSRAAGEASTAHTLLDEIAHFGSRAEPVDLCTLARAADETVSPLATAFGVVLTLHVPPGAATVYASEELLRQTLVTLFSSLVRHASGGSSSVHCHVGETLVLTAYLTPRSHAAFVTDAREVRDLALAQRYHWDVATCGQGRVVCTLTIPRRSRRVLLIEDNESTVALYQRYLAANRNWEVVACYDPGAGVAIAREQRPDLIVLDIMMPGLDGWSILQRLRVQPETHTTPVVVCTVFDEAELARTLGASGFLKKPVTRAALLQELNHHLKS